MKQSTQRILLRAALVILGVLVCVIAVIWLYARIDRSRQLASLYETAQQLGYLSPAHIAQLRHCWDVFPTHCGLVLHYRTALTLSQLETRVDGLGWRKTWAGEADGYAIFTDINTDTGSRLTADGHDGIGSRLAVEAPYAYTWRFVDPKDNTWSVTFYALAGEQARYEIDGRPLSANVVTVMIQVQ